MNGENPEAVMHQVQAELANAYAQVRLDTATNDDARVARLRQITDDRRLFPTRLVDLSSLTRFPSSPSRSAGVLHDGAGEVFREVHHEAGEQPEQR
jgi:hypothetical protein